MQTLLVQLLQQSQLSTITADQVLQRLLLYGCCKCLHCLGSTAGATDHSVSSRSPVVVVLGWRICIHLVDMQLWQLHQHMVCLSTLGVHASSSEVVGDVVGCEATHPVVLMAHVAGSSLLTQCVSLILWLRKAVYKSLDPCCPLFCFGEGVKIDCGVCTRCKKKCSSVLYYGFCMLIDMCLH